jgi:hypothetical protein
MRPERFSNVPGTEMLNPSGQELNMDNWESREKRAEEEYRGIVYEPPYSIWQAAVGFIVIAIGRLLCWWFWGE